MIGRLKPRLVSPHAFAADRAGSMAVEFALVSSVLLALFAVTLDLSYMVDAQRDAERASTLMARAMSSCPAAADVRPLTWKGTSGCVTPTINWLFDKKANVLVTFPAATVAMVPFVRSGGSLNLCYGRMTYLEADMIASGLALLKDQDVGMIAYIKMTYSPFLPSFSTFATPSTTSFRQYSIDIQGNGSYFQC